MIWHREPALILGAVNALIAVAVGFGLSVTPEQVGLINAAVAAVLSVVVRQQVTPVSRPLDQRGQAVVWWVLLGAVAAVVLLALLDEIDL